MEPGRGGYKQQDERKQPQVVHGRFRLGIGNIFFMETVVQPCTGAQGRGGVTSLGGFN